MKNKLNLVVVASAILLAVGPVMPASPPGPLSGETTTSCAALDANEAGPAYDHIVLVHRFSLPDKLAWGKISVDLAPAAWRIGGADGPPASAAQLRVALRTLGGLEIGGRCTGQVDGATAYPCGFAVRELGLAAQAGDRHSGIAMDWTPDPARAQVAFAGKQPTSMKDVFSPVTDTARFVGLQVAPHQLGDVDKALGRRLEFEIRAVSNPVSPSTFDLSSGLVKLCGTGQKLSL